VVFKKVQLQQLQTHKLKYKRVVDPNF